MIQSKTTEVSICTRCIHSINQVAENIPVGSIQCLRCKTIDGIVCSYRDETAAVFTFSGLDSAKRVIYTISNTTGKWRKGNTPFKITCVRCAASVPHWMMEFNPYVKSAHTS